MTGKIIEMRPGISKLDFSREPLGPETPVIPLTDIDMQISTFLECQKYALEVHAASYLNVSSVQLAKAANLAQTLATLMQAMSAARMANEAIEMARQVDSACRAALDVAEKL